MGGDFRPLNRETPMLLPASIQESQIKRYGGRRGHRDSRIGEKRWRFGIRSERGTVRGSEVRN